MRSASSVNPSSTAAAAAPKARDATYVDYKIRGSAIHLCPLSLSLSLSLSVLLLSAAWIGGITSRRSKAVRSPSLKFDYPRSYAAVCPKIS